MWQIYNKLFGWNYIAWSNQADSGVARLHTEKYSNKPFYWRYRNVGIFDMVENADQVVWLTCHPSEYKL